MEQLIINNIYIKKKKKNGRKVTCLALIAGSPSISEPWCKDKAEPIQTTICG